MEIEGLNARELEEQFGTPLYVYEPEKIRERYRELENEFGSRVENFKINYAVKSNFNPSVAEILVEEGAGLDCASKAEIKLANKLNADEIMYTAPYNRKDELEYAIENDAFVNLDSLFLLDKLDKVPKKICFRIDPGIGEGDFGLVFAGDDTKFGIPEDEAVEAYKKALEKGVEKFGIHMMTGSNIRDPDYFAEITEKLLEIAGKISDELGIKFEFVDIGGGLGIPYKPDQESLDIQETSEKVSEKFNEGIEKLDIGKPELRIEPGRFLVAESGHLLSKVTGIKEKEGTTFVGLDTGMHQNLRPSLLDAYHEIKVPRKGEKTCKTVVGPVCSSIDVIAEERKLPELKRGDIVSIEDVGAYGFVMASHWNSRPLPAEVLIEDGEAKLIREREEIDDIFHGTKLDKN